MPRYTKFCIAAKQQRPCNRQGCTFAHDLDQLKPIKCFQTDCDCTQFHPRSETKLQYLLRTDECPVWLIEKARADVFVPRPPIEDGMKKLNIASEAPKKPRTYPPQVIQRSERVDLEYMPDAVIEESFFTEIDRAAHLKPSHFSSYMVRLQILMNITQSKIQLVNVLVQNRIHATPDHAALWLDNLEDEIKEDPQWQQRYMGLPPHILQMVLSHFLLVARVKQ